MTTYLHIPVTDYSGEGATIDLPVDPAISDANITTLFNAVDGVSLGNFGQSTLNNLSEKDAGPGGAAADPFATRKGRWLCRCHDDTTLRKFNFTIPAPDLALLAGNTDLADLGAGAGATFKTAIDSHAEGPDGNGAVLDSVEFRGRNIKPKKSS